MTTLFSNKEYKVDYNGGNAYMIIDSSDQCIMVKTTLRTAKNYFNKVSKLSGVC